MTPTDKLLLALADALLAPTSRQRAVAREHVRQLRDAMRDSETERVTDAKAYLAAWDHTQRGLAEALVWIETLERQKRELARHCGLREESEQHSGDGI